MENVIELAAYRSYEQLKATSFVGTQQACVIGFKRRQTTMHNEELEILNRCLENIKTATEQNDTESLAEWRDELEVLALHCAQLDVWKRCYDALDTSSQTGTHSK